MERQSILNLGGPYGVQSILAVISHIIDPSAYWMTMHEPSVKLYGNHDARLPELPKCDLGLGRTRHAFSSVNQHSDHAGRPLV